MFGTVGLLGLLLEAAGGFGSGFAGAGLLPPVLPPVPPALPPPLPPPVPPPALPPEPPEPPVPEPPDPPLPGAGAGAGVDTGFEVVVGVGCAPSPATVKTGATTGRVGRSMGSVNGRPRRPLFCMLRCLGARRGIAVARPREYWGYQLEKLE